MTPPRILPPAVFFIFVVLELIAHFAMPISQWGPAPVRWGGLVIILLGAWFTIAADQHFKRVGTSVKPSQVPSVLVKDGLFKISRHPMYLGMCLMLLGEALALGTVTPLLGPVVFLLTIDTLYVTTEEQTLSEIFGDEHAKYKQRVHRWI